ncbi:hypothetical protein [Paraburkholderia sp. BR10882]
MSERISASEFARRAGCDVKQVRRALARGTLERGADGLIDAAMTGAAWRKANRRTLAKGALAARTDRGERTRQRDRREPGRKRNRPVA